MFLLLASGSLARVLDAHATDSASMLVEIGKDHGPLAIDLTGECRDSSCDAKSVHLDSQDPRLDGLVVDLQIRPTGSTDTFTLPYLVGSSFVAPVSGQLWVGEPTPDLERRVQEAAKSQCGDFKVTRLFLNPKA